MKYAVKFWKSGQNDGLCTFCSAWSALEDEYTGEEDRLIDRLLEKKQYDADTMDQKEKQKIYQYLMRRGFRSDAIRRRMNAE